MPRSVVETLTLNEWLTTHSDDPGQTHKPYTRYNDPSGEASSGYNSGTMWSVSHLKTHQQKHGSSHLIHTEVEKKRLISGH